MGFLKKKKIVEVNNELAEVKAEIVKEQEVPPIAQKEAQEIEVYEPEDTKEVPVEESVQAQPIQALPVKETLEELREKIRVAEEEAAMVEEEEKVAIEPEEEIEPELTEEAIKQGFNNLNRRITQLELCIQRIRLI